MNVARPIAFVSVQKSISSLQLSALSLHSPSTVGVGVSLLPPVIAFPASWTGGPVGAHKSHVSGHIARYLWKEIPAGTNIIHLHLVEFVIFLQAHEAHAIATWK